MQTMLTFGSQCVGMPRVWRSGTWEGPSATTDTQTTGQMYRAVFDSGRTVPFLSFARLRECGSSSDDGQNMEVCADIIGKFKTFH